MERVCESCPISREKDVPATRARVRGFSVRGEALGGAWWPGAVTTTAHPLSAALASLAVHAVVPGLRANDQDAKLACRAERHVRRDCRLVGTGERWALAANDQGWFASTKSERGLAGWPPPARSPVSNLADSHHMERWEERGGSQIQIALSRGWWQLRTSVRRARDLSSWGAGICGVAVVPCV